MTSPDRTVIDLFCGAGGLSEGLRQAGFRVCAGNDHDPAAGKTYESTHPGAKFIGGCIENLLIEDFLDAALLKRGELFCLAGGPPCQAFSVYNHQRGMHDARSQLFREYLRIVEGLSPRWIVLENVTGILSAGDGAAVKDILTSLRMLGYEVDFKVLRAEDYGVPQERRRVVFIGNRVGAPIIWPQVTHGDSDGLLTFTTIHDAISDLPALENGASQRHDQSPSEPISDFQREMRAGSALAHNHAAPRLSATNIQRMQHIRPGGSWRDIPHDLLPEGMKRAKRSDHTKRYGRMKWQTQACTILTKCDVHWGAYIHPDQDRAISVREAARLQSFPDWFVFQGSKTEQYVQVGNAVPPLLGKAIGQAILAAEQALTVTTMTLCAAE